MNLSYQPPFSTLQRPVAYLTTSVWRRKRVIGLNIRCRWRWLLHPTLEFMPASFPVARDHLFFFHFFAGGGGAYSEAGKKGVMGRDSPLALCAHFHYPLANILAFLDPNRKEKWQFCSEPVNRLPVPLASQPDFSIK